jgi:glycosyltransferase involved in cell wall biosynthesis
MPSRPDAGNPSVLILAHAWPPSPWIGAVRPVYLSRQLAALGWRPIIVTIREEDAANVSSGGVADEGSALVIRTRSLRNPRHALVKLRRAVRRVLSLGRPVVQAESVRPYALEEDLAFRAPGLKEHLTSLLYVPDEFLGWFPFALRAAIGAVRRHRPVCVISTGPPHTTHLVAMALKRVCNIAWIADLRDPWAWHDHPPGTHTLWSDRLNTRLEAAVIRSANCVVSVAPGVTREYARRYPAEPAEKWVTITNGFDASEFDGLGHVERAERFTVSYVGSMSFQRSPILLLRALAELIAEGAIDRTRVAVRFMGDCEFVGDRSLASIIADMGLEEVAEVLPLAPRTQALRELLRSHVLLLIAGTQRLCIAAKLFEYLAAGRPILAISGEGATADIVNRLGAGRVVAPDDLRGAKDALLDWYKEFVAAGDCRGALEQDQTDAKLEYDWTRLGPRYSELIKLLGGATNWRDRPRIASALR